MNILILSDTHGQIAPEILVLAEQCNLAVHCGDIGNQAVLDQLSSRVETVAVRGNNDIRPLWPPAEAPLMESIPWETTLELPGGQLAVCHGHKANPVKERHSILRATFPQARAIAYGHSHKMVIDAADPKRWVVNPGAAGRTRTNGGPSCLVLNIENDHWSISEHRFQLGRAG